MSADTKIAVIETDVGYIKKAVDKINGHLEKGDEVNKELVKALQKIDKRVLIVEKVSEDNQKKIQEIHARVELACVDGHARMQKIEGKQNDTDMYLSNVKWWASGLAVGAGAVGGLLIKFILPLMKFVP